MDYHKMRKLLHHQPLILAWQVQNQPNVHGLIDLTVYFKVLYLCKLFPDHVISTVLKALK